MGPLAAVAAFALTAGPLPGQGAAPAQVSVLSAAQVIQLLDDTVEWYRTLGTQQQAAADPRDLLIVYANRQTAAQVVGLAFDIARANAELLSSEAKAAPAAAGSTGSSSDSFDHEHAQVESQLDSVQQDLKRESPAKKPALQGELAMLSARKNLLDTMSDFVEQSNPQEASANALKAQIEAIAAAIPQLGVPSVPAGGSPAAAPAALPAAAEKLATRTGIWDLGVAALNLRRKLKTIDTLKGRTASLSRTFADFSAPSRSQLKAYAVRSDALAAQARSADEAAQKMLRAEFDTLAWLFKQTSGILLPLDKERVLLQQYGRNLDSWRVGAVEQYHDALQALAVRLAILGAILCAVIGLAEVSKRAVLHYAHEPRRRSQLLMVQRIVFWISIVAIVGLSFATEISTFATFAGLLTAGVAVAMQSVLVSVVGYFFLIGKYGIRVGDRIQIGTVVGEVIDIGLVRMHLMELSSNGPLGPTGRVVAFANLIVFQASGLFKQIPGVNLSWHETTLNLPSVADYGALKERLQTALAAVLVRYREELSRQNREIEKTTATTASTRDAEFVQMHLVDGRMVAAIRYPVHSEDAADIDEQVAEAVLKVIGRDSAER
ncbi:MAG TPA: mechanosensitive ion channel domain-containing protein [Steroidobacteraceae bacterium]